MIFPNALAFAGFLLLWALVLFVLFDLRGTEHDASNGGPSSDVEMASLKEVIRTEGKKFCTDAESCMAVHLSSSMLGHFLSKRCKRFADAVEATPIVFTHIPKSGGSSVRTYLQRQIGTRLISEPHEHFLQRRSTGKTAISYVTLLREPVSRAISFYSYVRDCQKFPPHEEGNQLWHATYNADPVAWSRNQEVQSILALEPVDWFLPGNFSHFNKRVDYSKLTKSVLQPTSLGRSITGDIESLLHYTHTLPVQYQCKQHLEVAVTLLQHYHVVGTLEKIEDFYRILPSRVGIEPTSFRPHLNRSKFQREHLDAAHIKDMSEQLKPVLYCATVLWRIAGMISDADKTCIKP